MKDSLRNQEIHLETNNNLNAEHFYSDQGSDSFNNLCYTGDKLGLKNPGRNL